MVKKSKGTLAIALLALLHGVVLSGAVEVRPSVDPALVGDTVTLSLSPPAALSSGSWAVGQTLILTWTGGQQAVFPAHSGRASVNVLTGALTLTAATVADTGVYEVKGGDPEIKASASVTVLELITGVNVTADQNDLVEFSSSVRLSCSVSSGSSLSFLWLNGTSDVTASDRVQLTDENKTLTIVNVTRYDQGPFSCRVSNPLSNATGGPLNLTISYGPDNMVLAANGLNATTAAFPVGSNLSLLCGAQSSPPAELQWTFRGQPVNATGPLWEMVGVGEDQSGPYSCLAFNNHTDINSSVTTHITIGNASGQPVVNVWLPPLLLLVGVLFSLPGKL